MEEGSSKRSSVIVRWKRERTVERFVEYLIAAHALENPTKPMEGCPIAKYELKEVERALPLARVEGDKKAIKASKEIRAEGELAREMLPEHRMQKNRPVYKPGVRRILAAFHLLDEKRPRLALKRCDGAQEWSCFEHYR